MNANDIVRALVVGNFTNEDLNKIVEALKYARTSLTKRTKASLMLGDRVKWTNSRTGGVMQGTVSKVAIKYITVNTGAGLWRVPANMLTVV